jgi:predicted permease
MTARWWDVVRMRTRSLARRRRVESDLERELRFHLEQQMEENRARGMTDEKARNAALRRIGGVAQVQEECREMRRVEYFEQFTQDLRYAARSLGKSPGFTAVIVLTLALSIGANSAIFSVIEGVLLRPLPYGQPEQIARVFTKNKSFPKFPVNHWDFRDFRSTARSFESMGLYTRADLQLSGVGEPVRLSGFRVSAGFFHVLGLQPARGREFTQNDELPGTNKQAIISDRVWRSRFDGAPDIVGRKIMIESEPFTVTGVMPPGTDHPGNSYNPIAYGDTVDIWVPFTFGGNPARRGSHFTEVIGRLKPGVSPAQAEAELNAMMVDLGSKYEAEKGWTTTVVPLYREVVGASEQLLLVLLGAVGLVLLIACVNAANLLLARATARQREIAVRTALGAGRGRLVRQMLTESLLIALAGGAAGAALAVAGTKTLVTMLPAGFPRAAAITLNGSVFAFTFAVAIATGLLFGLVPALQAARFDVQAGLREGGRGSTGTGRTVRLRSVLVAGEVALASVLLIGAGLMLRSFVNLLRTDPGFRSQHVLTARMALPGQTYRDRPAIARFYERTLAELRATPGIQAAGVGSDLPWTGYDDNMGGWKYDDRPSDPNDSSHARYHNASPDYFRALGIPLLRGRYFTDADTESAPKVLLINQAMARKYWPNEDAVGKRIDFGFSDKPEWTTIVGVVGDVKDRPESDGAEPAFWWPSAQTLFGTARMAVVIRATADPTPLVRELREVVRRLDPGLAVSDVRVMEQVADDSYSTPRFALFLVALFAGLALALAATGVYGVVSYAVGQRMHEFGMRMALGAGRWDVIRLVLGQGVRLAAIGVALGLVGGAVLAQLLGTLLYEVKRVDIPTYAAVAVVGLAVASLACYVPARRATSADPIQALRSE